MAYAAAAAVFAGAWYGCRSIAQAPGVPTTVLTIRLAPRACVSDAASQPPPAAMSSSADALFVGVDGGGTKVSERQREGERPIQIAS